MDTNSVNCYKIFLDGAVFIAENPNKKPLLRRCERLARNPHNYVELWYYHGNGTRTLVKFWN